MSEPISLTSRLERVFRSVFHDIQGDPITLTRLDTSIWDSATHLFLLLSLEEEFGIVLSDADAIDVTSFESAVEVVCAKVET